jgi:oligoribonuclease
MKLLWLDVETTGLDPNKDRLLEVAALVTDLATPFDIEGEPVEGVFPVAEEDAKKFDPFIIEMHTKNGLLDECVAVDKGMMLTRVPRTDHLSRPEAARYNHALLNLEDALLALIPDMDEMTARLGKEEARKNITAIAGSSVHFDLGFLRVHMPRLAKNLSHRCYDVSAVKLFCRSLGMPKPPPEEAHRALKDVHESMAHAKVCRDWLAVAQNLTSEEKTKTIEEMEDVVVHVARKRLLAYKDQRCTDLHARGQGGHVTNCLCGKGPGPVI